MKEYEAISNGLTFPSEESQEENKERKEKGERKLSIGDWNTLVQKQKKKSGEISGKL